jgi:hypothetical protein
LFIEVEVGIRREKGKLLLEEKMESWRLKWDWKVDEEIIVDEGSVPDHGGGRRK